MCNHPGTPCPSDVGGNALWLLNCIEELPEKFDLDKNSRTVSRSGTPSRGREVRRERKLERDREHDRSVMLDCLDICFY